MYFLIQHLKNSNMKNDQQTKAPGRTVDVTREINAPVEAVWKALTNAKELERWFPLHASVEPGEAVELSWGDKVDWRMEVEEEKDLHYLRLGYGQEHHSIVSPEPRRLAVEFFLEAKGGKTLLRIVHAGFGGDRNWDDMYDGVRRGWDTESLSLKHYLENHAGKDRLVALARRKTRKSHEEIWDILTQNGLSIDQDSYVYTTPLGGQYAGSLLYFNPPQDLCGTIRTLNNAMFRLMLDRYHPDAEIDVWAWIGAYDVPEQQIREIEKKWQERLDALLR